MTESQSKVIRYAIYTRQSTERLDDFTSCDGQFVICQEFVEQSGEPGLHWCGSIDAEGYSGATPDCGEATTESRSPLSLSDDLLDLVNHSGASCSR